MLDKNKKKENNNNNNSNKSSPFLSVSVLYGAIQNEAIFKRLRRTQNYAARIATGNFDQVNFITVDS